MFLVIWRIAALVAVGYERRFADHDVLFALAGRASPNSALLDHELAFGDSHDKLISFLQKDPTVLGTQASSPARVPSNQELLNELVALDTGRRGRLRSQDRGPFCKSLSGPMTSHWPILRSWIV